MLLWRLSLQVSEEPGEESWTRAGDKAELLAQASPDTHRRGRLLTTFLAVLRCVAQSVGVVLRRRRGLGSGGMVRLSRRR